MKIFKPLLLLALAISVVGLASAAPFEQRSQRFVGGVLSGPLAYEVCSQAPDDATPAMGTVPGGCNVLETSDANTGACNITTLDGPILPGMIIWIVGKGGTHPTTITKGGDFTLKNDWTGETDRVLELYVQGIDDFVESDRTGGPRVFDDSLTIGGDFDVDGHNIILDQDGDFYVEGDRSSTVGDDEFVLRLGGSSMLVIADSKWAISTTSDNATGDEYGINHTCIINKATSGATYCNRTNMIDTASPGTGFLAWWGVSGVSKAYVRDTGKFYSGSDVVVAGNLSMQTGGSIISTSAGNITIAPVAGGDTVIDGTSGEFIVNDVAKFAELITDTGSGATELGTVCASENGTGNVCVGGELRVEGTNNVYSGKLSVINTFSCNLIATAAAALYAHAGGQHIALNPVYNRALIITDYDWQQTVHGFSEFANPTLIIKSAASPVVGIGGNQYGKFSHDGTTDTDGDMTIATGAGGIVLTPDDKYLIPPRILSNAPAEPVACGVGYDGAMVYVDDTDDTAYGRICVCANLDGTGYDWRDAGDIVGTACPFF